jgi:transposase
MLSKEAVIVLRHYLQEGLSTGAMARRLGISRRTVQRYIKSGKTEPSYGPRPPQPSKLDPYRAYLRSRLEAYPELSAVRLLQELRSRGYTGGITILKDFLATLRPHPLLPYEQRFEVPPGEQAQVDFATFKTLFGQVQALLVVLSWSRALWVRFVLHQDQLTVLTGLHQAFLAFGGVPRTVLFDRMRTAVAGAGPAGMAIFNPELLRFAAHYGFRPMACRPYRAKTKGRVERAVSYLRRNFFYGRTFRDLANLNAQCAGWLVETANARVHGTTGEVPQERLGQERDYLLPLPAAPYVPMVTLGRRVTRDGFISYNGNAYSVPEGLDRAEIQVRATLTELRLLQGGRLVAVHPLLEGRGQRRLDPAHRRRRTDDQRTTGQGTAATPLDLIEVERRPLEVYEGVLS